MMNYDCDAVRDLLPSLVRGEMLPHEAASLEHHLIGCETCRGEAEIVRALQDSFVPVPAGLETRVIAAVRSRSPQRRVPAPMALAATLAAAVLGGSLIINQAFTGRNADDLDVATLSWAAAEDPLLHGSTELHDLSAEELEFLLSELER